MSNEISTQEINEILQNKNIESVEGRVPELVATLIKCGPALIKPAVELINNNDKIKKEVIEYTHESAIKAIEGNYSIAKIGAENLKNVNQHLGKTLENLSKKENLSDDELEIYFTTLQMINNNNEDIDNLYKDNQEFIEKTQIKETEKITKERENEFLNVAIKVIGDFANTKEGQEVIARGVYELGRGLYKGLARIYG